MLGKDNKIWHNINNSIKTGFDSEPVYNKKSLRIKIKPNEGNNQHKFS